MKRIILTLLLFLSILLFSTGVFAQETLLLGSSEQKASNPDNDLISTSLLNWEFSEIFTSATCTISLSSYSTSKGISNNYNNDFRKDINLTFNGFRANTPFSITNNTIEIKAVIPAILDAVNEDGNAQSFNIGTITCTYGEKSEVRNLFMQRKNELEFDRVNLFTDDKSERLRNNQRIDNIKPGNDVRIEARIKNLFSRSDSIYIEDVDFFVRAKNDLDIDEEEFVGSIAYAETITEIANFQVARDVNEGTYGLTLTTLGEDEYGARHGNQLSYQVRIRKENDDLRLLRVDLNPSAISLCDSNFAAITVTAENIGRNNQRQVSLVVRNDALNYYERFNDLIVNRDDFISRRFLIELPSNTKQNVYRFIVEVYNDKNEITDTREITLSVRECSDASDSGVQDPRQQQVSTGGTIVSGDLASAQKSGGAISIVSTEEEKESRMSLPLLALLVTVVLLLIILLLILLIK